MAERTTALAHDHGFQATRTLEGDALHRAAVGEHLQGEGCSVARTEVCFVAQLYHTPSKAFGKGGRAGGVIKAGGTELEFGKLPVKCLFDVELGGDGGRL